jgi:hypothetical protein
MGNHAKRVHTLGGQRTFLPLQSSRNGIHPTLWKSKLSRGIRTRKMRIEIANEVILDAGTGQEERGGEVSDHEGLDTTVDHCYHFTKHIKIIENIAASVHVGYVLQTLNSRCVGTNLTLSTAQVKPTMPLNESTSPSHNIEFALLRTQLHLAAHRARPPLAFHSGATTMTDPM